MFNAADERQNFRLRLNLLELFDYPSLAFTEKCPANTRETINASSYREIDFSDFSRFPCQLTPQSACRVIPRLPSRVTRRSPLFYGGWRADLTSSYRRQCYTSYAPVSRTTTWPATRFSCLYRLEKLDVLGPPWWSSSQSWSLPLFRWATEASPPAQLENRLVFARPTKTSLTDLLLERSEEDNRKVTDGED